MRGNVLADALQLTAATADGRCRLVHDLLARQLRRQGGTLRLLLVSLAGYVRFDQVDLGLQRCEVCLDRLEQQSLLFAGIGFAGGITGCLRLIHSRGGFVRTSYRSRTISSHRFRIMSHGYRVRPIRDVNEWEAYFSAVQRPHLMQSYAYGEAKRIAAGWHINRCVFERSGVPVAICQVLEKRIAGWHVASRINRGPMFLDDSPSHDVKENVMGLVKERWNLLHGGPLLIAPALEASEENRNILTRLGYRDRKKDGWCSSLLDLRQDEADMRKRLAPTWRNRLRASINSRLELRISNSYTAVEWMLERHVENMKALRFRGPTKALLRALHKEKPQDFLVLQAVFEDRPVAGLILARYGQTAEYYVGWFGEAGRKFNCGNFLYWHAALEAKKAGHQWFDLGGYYSTDKFGQFKLGMRGAEYRLVGEWFCF